MTDNNDISLKISCDVVKPIVEAKIQAAIVAALGDGHGLIEAAVSRAMGQKVDEKGNISRYSSDNNHSYIEVVCGNLIRDLAKKALAEWVEQNKPKILEAIKRNLAKQSGPLAVAFVNGLIHNVETRYRSNIEVYFKEGK